MKSGVARLLAGATLLVFCALAALVLWINPVEDRAEVPAASHAPRVATSDEHEDKRPETLVPVSPRLPASLLGTSEDGALVIAMDGRFVPTLDAIDLFDYYLSATGEESEEQIRARIIAAIQSKLNGEDAATAVQLLDSYLRYREQASMLITGPQIGEDLERRLQYIRELRREVFGAKVAAALFGAEEARLFADLERRRVASDNSLDPAERAQRLADLDAQLPAEDLAARESARSHSLLRQEEAQMREAGADSIEIAQLRSERFGEEAAARLSLLDASRGAWETRLDRYRAERDQLIAQSPADARESLIEGVRARHFVDGELVRVRALDGMEASSSLH